MKRFSVFPQRCESPLMRKQTIGKNINRMQTMSKNTAADRVQFESFGMKSQNYEPVLKRQGTKLTHNFSRKAKSLRKKQEIEKS